MKNTEPPQKGTTQNGLAQEPITRILSVSPMISWVNPFPSWFILIERLESRQKCHISESPVCHREKIKWKSEARLSIVFQNTIRQKPMMGSVYVHFYDFTAAGI